VDTVADIRARLAEVENSNITALEQGLARIAGMRQALREAAVEVKPSPDLLAEWHAQLDETEVQVQRTLEQARAVRQIMLIGRLHELGQA
jgi:hypothetical protein